MTTETVSQTICKHADVLDDELDSARCALLLLLASAKTPHETGGDGSHLEPLCTLAQALHALSAEVGFLRNLGEQVGKAPPTE